MASITTLLATDALSDSRSDINTNFSNLNTDKLESSDVWAAALSNSYNDLDDLPAIPAISTTTETSSATVTPTGDGIIRNQLFITAQAVWLTINAPSGIAVNGNSLVMRIKDDGTTRSITWNAIYADGFGVSLPTDTTAGKTHYLGFMYNSATSKWDLTAYAEEA